MTCLLKTTLSRKIATARRVANHAPEARMQVRALHSRVPAWKLSKCIQALSAQPNSSMDLAHIADVTEIQFASNELVEIAPMLMKQPLAARKSRIDNAVSQSVRIRRSQKQDTEC